MEAKRDEGHADIPKPAEHGRAVSKTLHVRAVSKQLCAIHGRQVFLCP